ncbi:adenine phosphoribosyltransferase [Desulfurispira natronophila]|uniref:Adenine phosphoribosyltransferase n=1 Tax=Desulfurispira natronophila TaxID=682562 RepID=A0A7W7Y2T4_9BACT|nr:adenine phosphoribosyltransferase [Desulfurispira natronophila]MBB5020757.1 adenine phosphoribosyltransferase [Desulfurispira natronophila]
MDFSSKVRDIIDFPKPGIVFKDITPLLQDPCAFQTAIDMIADRHVSEKIDAIVAVESRGFIIGSALAYKLGCSLVVARKAGKLPYENIGVKYMLEYGEDELQIHVDALLPGQKVLIADDLLATGGTIEATAKLVEKLGANVVEAVFLIELLGLGGRSRIADVPCFSLMQFSV